MTTQVQALGAPRDDLAAATLGIEPVPARFRVLGFLDYFVLWADLGVGLLVLLAGTLLVPGLGFWTALAAIVVGTLAGNLLLGLAGTVGSDYGVPSMVTLRPSFGVRGSYLPSLVNAVQLIGWAAFEVIIMAHASQRIAAPLLGTGSYPIWAVIWSGVVVLMALGGPLVVVRQWLEKAGIWIVLATATWIVLYVVTHYDVAAAVARPGDGSLTFAQAVDLVVAMPISWLPLVADYNRFARDSRSAFWGTFLGYAVANVSFYALGALLILVLPTHDLIGAMLSVAFGAAGLVLLLGDETDNAFADIYSTAISVKNILPGWSTRWLVAGFGLIALGIALAVDLTQYQGFLFLVGSLFTPLFGVLFADYFVLRHRRYDVAALYDPAAGGHVRGTNPIALLAWAVGVAAYFAVINGAPWLGGTLPSLAASLAAYLVLHRLLA